MHREIQLNAKVYLSAICTLTERSENTLVIKYQPVDAQSVQSVLKTCRISSISALYN